MVHCHIIHGTDVYYYTFFASMAFWMSEDFGDIQCWGLIRGLTGRGGHLMDLADVSSRYIIVRK